MSPQPNCSELAATITNIAMNIGSRPGIRHLDDVVSKMREEFPEIERKAVVDAIVEATTYGPRVRSELAKKLSDLKREAKNDAATRKAIDQLETFLKTGKALPVKKARRASPEAILELRKQRDDLVREKERSDPAKRAEIRKQISVLNEHLKNGTIPPKPFAKEPAQIDLLILRAERDKLQREVSRVGPAREQAIRQRIGELDRHLAAGTEPAPQRTPEPLPARIQKLVDQRNELDARVRASGPKAKQKLVDRITELDKLISEGKGLPEAPPRKPVSEEIEALRKKRDKLMSDARMNDPAKRDQLRSEIAELQDHIDNGTQPVRRPRKASPEDLMALRKQKSDLDTELRRNSPERYRELNAQIETMEDHLHDGTLPAPRAGAKAPSDDIAELEAWRDELNTALKGSDPAIVQRLTESVDNVKAELAKPELSLPEAKPSVELSKQAGDLQYEQHRLKKQLDARLEKLKPKTIFGTGIAGLNTMRAVMTSFDLSAVLRQGGFIALGNPVRAAKAFGPMFSALKSERNAYDINESIVRRDNAHDYHASELYLGPLDAKPSAREEGFMTNLAGKIPGVSHSERAYITFLNVLRADTFDSMVASLSRNGQATAAEKRAIAQFINVATGRADLGSLAKHAEAFNAVFFAPRYVASRFQLLGLQPLLRGGSSARVKGAIAKEYAKYLAGVGLFYAISHLAGGELEGDPRSSDFGKVKFGKARVDPLSGLSQTAVFTNRVGLAAAAHLGLINPRVARVKNVNTGRLEEDRHTALGRFLRSKLSPITGAAVDIYEGENLSGQKVNAGSAAEGLVTPLVFNDIYNALRYEGIEKGSALSLLAIFGAGMQVYQPQRSLLNDTYAAVTGSPEPSVRRR